MHRCTREDVEGQTLGSVTRLELSSAIWTNPRILAFHGFSNILFCKNNTSHCGRVQGELFLSQVGDTNWLSDAALRTWWTHKHAQALRMDPQRWILEKWFFSATCRHVETHWTALDIEIQGFFVSLFSFGWFEYCRICIDFAWQIHRTLILTVWSRTSGS